MDETPPITNQSPRKGHEFPAAQPTIGQLSREEIERKLLDGGQPGITQRIWKCLLTLSSGAADSMFVGAYLSFVGDDEALSILHRWAGESQHAAALAFLGDTVRGVPGWPEAVRPFGDDQQVRKRMHGSLDLQYLAAACAVRRPIGVPALARFAVQLRVLCIVRALEALDYVGASHETNLSVVCTTVRRACDNEGDPRLPWLEKIRADGTSLADFADSVTARCRAAQGTGGLATDERGFYEALQTVLAGGPWNPDDRYARREPLSTGALSGGSPRPPVDLRWIVGDSDDQEPIHLPIEGGGVLQVQTLAADPNQTPARNQRDGAGVLIEAVEAVQFLRHSWHHLSTQEQAALFERVGALLDTDERADRLGACLVLVGILAGMPLSAVGTVTISPEPCGDWRLDPDSWELRRRPPRFGRGWRPDPSAAGWVKPAAEVLRIELHANAVAALREAWNQDQPFDLAGLWQTASPELELDAWFAKAIRSVNGLERITGPALSHVLSVDLYERSEDQTFTRVMGSRLRSGLPASCAYGSYGADKVALAYPSDQEAPLYRLIWPSPTADLNSAGSELDPIIERVHVEVQALTARTLSAWQDSADWVQRHNLLTALAVTALLASTGARPTSSPFQTLAWIDPIALRLFVEDKVSGPTGGGRLCVLSDIAREIVFDRYLPHLRDLAEFAQSGAPRFAEQLRDLLSGNPDAGLPLFFFVKSAPRLTWMEVTETQLQVFSGVAWPLPWNLFRHLHASELVRMGVHSEIVDALLAHADRGAESHGDFSLRVPARDLESARPEINKLVRRLGFDFVAWPEPPGLAHPLISEELAGPADQAFGRAARAEAREATRAAARQRALDDINVLIAGRPLDSLSAEQWDEIALAMLFRERGGMPHPAASIRYGALEDYLDQAWQKQRIIAKIKRRHVLIEEGESLINEHVLVASAQLSALSSSLEALLPRLRAGRTGPRLSAVLAAVDLVVNSRVAHRKFLTDLVCLRSSVQCVRFQGVDWIEWSDATVWRDGRPVYRVRASARAAALTATAVGGKNELRALPAPPAEVTQLCVAFCGTADLDALLRKMCALQDQLNILELPGVDAAYLAGRAVLSALPHRDWFRLQRGATPAPPPKDGAYDNLGSAVGDSGVAYVIERRQAVAREGGKPSTPKDCHELFESIRKALTENDAPAACTAVEKAVSESGYTSGDAPFVLGSFICHLLTRKPKKERTDGRDRLRVTTVQRAWYALAAPMTELAHDLSLADSDEEELTTLYSDIVDWWDGHFDDELAGRMADDKPDVRARLSREERVADACRRTLTRLQEFHAYAQTAFGLEDPDWSEITATKAGTSGRPGYVCVAEYLRGIGWMLAGRSAEQLPEDDLGAALVWVLCGRFGLRLGEAVGLYRRDFVELKGSIVVLVRSNHTRPLKTTKSKRQVPLVGEMHESERAVLDEALRRWSNRHKDGTDAPLLAGLDRSSFRGRRGDIGESLRALVRAVTGNHASTLHMLRHSYATRMLALLRGTSLGQGEPLTAEQTMHARKLLLGSAECGRRTLWAVARLLGHSSPAATLRSYLHSIETWIPAPHAAAPMRARGDEDQVAIDLDAWPVRQVALEPHAMSSAVHVEPAIVRILRFARLWAQGYSRDAATATSRVSIPDRDAFMLAFDLAAKRHRAEGDVGSDSDTYADTDELRMLRPIPLVHWDALIAHFGNANGRTSDLPAELDLTLGRRRQVILFERDHFTAFAAFVRDLHVDSSDVALVTIAGLDAEVRGWIDTAGLAKLAITQQEAGRTFQLDTTFSKMPRQPVTHRVVAVRAKTSSRFLNNYWLMVMWVAWNAAASSAAKS